MRLTELKSDKLVWVKINPYLIEWESKSPSKFQFAMKQFLKPYWKNSIVCEEFVIPKSRLRIDFINFNKKIVIETSGKQHIKFNKFFHNNSRLNYKSSIERDFAKLEWCERNNFKFIEVFEEEMPVSRQFFKDKFDLELV